MGTEATLELSTLVPDRVKFSVKSELHPDGRLYELRKRDELGPETLQEIAVLSQQAESIAIKADNDISTLSGEEARLLEDWTERVLELCCYTEVEPEVMEGLTFNQRMEVVALFMATSLPTPSRAVRRATPKKRTGAK